MKALLDAVLAAMPGSMSELAARTGVAGQPLWDAISTLRKAGVAIRLGKRGARVYDRAPEPPPDDDPAAKRERRRPIILFHIPGWPSQDPGRRMVWRICWDGGLAARRELEHLKATLGHEAEWEIAMMTASQARRLRAKGYDMREALERERELRQAAEAVQAS